MCIRDRLIDVFKIETDEKLHILQQWHVSYTVWVTLKFYFIAM